MKCSYCLKEMKKGTGSMYVFKTGKINYYCTSRCYKNDILHHRKINKKRLGK
ncbi:50S ribosomal protein L24 [Candidatus Marsarchaeota archaeon]|nr:50S ribosomal protein L24 [Candidatus Marsarchaeota archaeon]MCL5093228.1 50S ribosomal protein L24 [Candidatus Marsarchaeota archaeon]